MRQVQFVFMPHRDDHSASRFLALGVVCALSDLCVIRFREVRLEWLPYG